MHGLCMHIIPLVYSIYHLILDMIDLAWCKNISFLLPSSPMERFRPGHHNYAVEFQYSLLSCEFNFNVLPIHTIPDTSTIHTTREEIDSLYNNMNDLLKGRDETHFS